MYRREVIQALFGRVGFRQPTQSGSPVITPENKKCDSGRFFQDYHAIVSPENIKATAEDPALDDAKLNTYLKDLQESAIAAVLDGIFSVPEIIEQRLELIRGTEEVVPVANQGLFVGRQIRVVPDPTILVRVTQAALFFNGVATFNLYLFHNLKKTSLYSKEVTTEANSQVVTKLGWDLSYMAAAYKTGVFFLGYFQDDLGGVQAVDERACWYAGNCYDSTGMAAVRNPAPEVDFVRTTPQLSSVAYGLNLEFTSGKDYTEIILNNVAAFDKAIGLQMAAMVVEKIINSVRSNKTERITREIADRLYIDLNQAMPTVEMPYSYGLKKQLDRELMRLHNNFFPKDTITAKTVPACSTQRMIP
ncbi:hypothetical protein [Chitinophaga sp. YIM B06452]|uniref:hypothetical protein n=1 Tax=Chitinophaga sp. YIM B06452 TaxID=3082158 RepID=UPI0031FF2917